MPINRSEHTKISFLFAKYLNGTCSKTEADEIVSILEEAENDISLLDEVSNQWDRLSSTQNDESNLIENQQTMNQILDKIHHRIHLDEEKDLKKTVVLKKSVGKVFTLFSRVAAILILPLLIYSLYLSYEKFKTGSSAAGRLVWQTVKTPAGMQTDFVLPDGSHIWLNSGSVLSYPLPFVQEKREVTLTGEAFFDVTRDNAHPFVVTAGKMNIEVKGTRFNVINYTDEKFTELILESGSVHLIYVDYKGNKFETQIKPGEHATLDNTRNLLSVNKVDVSKYTAWKEGMLIFRDDQMDEVVRKLNRWFNVEIILQSPELKDYVYTATYRDETLPQILELLKISAPVKYLITDRNRLPDNSYTKRKITITKRN